MATTESKFVQAFNRHTKGLESLSYGICSKCDDCQANYDMGPEELDEAVSNCSVCDEGCFSWSDCDTCGSTLGGNRYDAHAFMSLTERGSCDHLLHLNVCEDCLMYIANGDEPERWEG